MQPPSGLSPIENSRSANKPACLSGYWSQEDGWPWGGEILSCAASFLPSLGRAPQGWGGLSGLSTWLLGSQPSVQRTLLLTPGSFYIFLGLRDHKALALENEQKTPCISKASQIACSSQFLQFVLGETGKTLSRNISLLLFY